MKRYIFLTVLVFALFMGEYVVLDFFGRWFKPNLFILSIIFFNVSLGTRYGLYTAVLAGLMKDGFSTGAFGIYLCSFVACNYAVTMVKRYIFYQVDSGSLRIFLVFSLSFLHVSLVYVLSLTFGIFDLYEVFTFVMLPEVVMTTIVAGFIFDKLKICALKFSV